MRVIFLLKRPQSRVHEEEKVTETISVGTDTATCGQVAAALFTTEAGLAQMRYRGTGPRYVKRGRRVIYRWSDVRAYLDENTIQRTGDPRGVA